LLTKSPEQIDRAVAALLALAFELAVAQQANKPCAALRSSEEEISRETDVPDSHVPDGIFSMISVSILRALIRWGSLLARSVSLRNVSIRELRAFRTIVKSPRRRVRR